eukprot:scaffold201003_cov45-Attheya_sp.AAC.1
MVYFSNFWLNSFLTKGGISDTMSPRAIVVGTNLDYAKHCQLEFGMYAQTHEEHDNSMAPRTIGAIALCPTGNAQVRDLARCAKAVRGFTVSDRNGIPLIEDDDDHSDDESYQPDDEDSDDESDAENTLNEDFNIAGVNANENGENILNPAYEENPNAEENPNDNDEEEDPNAEENVPEGQDDTENIVVEDVEDEMADVADDEIDENVDENNEASLDELMTAA